MNIYLKKIYNHDITHQISITKEISSSFFCMDSNETHVIVKGYASGYEGDVVILTATDPRLGGEIKTIVHKEGGISEGDFLLFTKSTNKYILKIIPKSDSTYDALSSIMQTERHLVINLDDDSLLMLGEIDRPCQKIFFGATGTGKNYGVDKLISNHYPNVNIKDNPFVFRTTVYSDYSYYNFIGNIMPTSKDGEIGYEFKAGVFTQALAKAFEHSDKEIFLVIEEMSRGDIASIFGDIFQLLDRDDSGISDYSINNDLVSNYLNEKNIDIGGKIYLPRNLHIIGTVNTSDQNVNVIDTAFKRRFEFVYVDVNPVKDDNDNFLNSFTFKLDDTEFEWNKFYMSLNELITTKLELSEDKQIGQFFIKFNNFGTDEQKLDEIKNKLLHYLWDDVQGAVISDECSIFKKNEYKTFSSLYKAFGNGENVFSGELMTIYTNKSI